MPSKEVIWSPKAVSDLSDRLARIENAIGYGENRGGINNPAREKAFRIARTVSSAEAYPTDTGSTVFEIELGKPSYTKTAGVQSLNFTPYTGNNIRYAYSLSGYVNEGDTVAVFLAHGQYYIVGGGGLDCASFYDLLRDCNICKWLCENCDIFATEDGTCDPPPPLACCGPEGGTSCQFFPTGTITSLTVADGQGSSADQVGTAIAIDDCSFSVEMSNGETATVTFDFSTDTWDVTGVLGLTVQGSLGPGVCQGLMNLSDGNIANGAMSVNGEVCPGPPADCNCEPCGGDQFKLTVTNISYLAPVCEWNEFEVPPKGYVGVKNTYPGAPPQVWENIGDCVWRGTVPFVEARALDPAIDPLGLNCDQENQFMGTVTLTLDQAGNAMRWDCVPATSPVYGVPLSGFGTQGMAGGCPIRDPQDSTFTVNCNAVNECQPFVDNGATRRVQVYVGGIYEACTPTAAMTATALPKKKAGTKLKEIAPELFQKKGCQNCKDIAHMMDIQGLAGVEKNFDRWAESLAKTSGVPIETVKAKMRQAIEASR